MISPGTILQNRYRILDKVGGGGFGYVYKAIDDVFGCCVAIKETKEQVASLDQLRKAFEREAKLLRNLKHECLPRVTDYFFHEQAQFLVMDFIEGEDLAARLKWRIGREGPFDVRKVLHWADKILNALEYLHTRPEPIVHRDIKPSNIKLTEDGEIYLLDFGLAKGAAGQMSTVMEGESSFSLAAFTHAYASLEQQQESGTQPQSDIYSVGATLYHLLTGQIPIAAGQRDEANQRGLGDPLKPVHALRPTIPSAVSEVISQAMAIRWWDRLSSAREMRAALNRAAADIADSPLQPDPRPPPPAFVIQDHVETLPLQSQNLGLAKQSPETTPTQAAIRPARPHRSWLVAGLSVVILSTVAVGVRLTFPHWFVATTNQPSPPANGAALITPTDLRPRAVATHAGVWSVDFSPDGSLAASASENNTIILWDTKTWKPKLSEPLTGHDLAFSPDGKLLAGAGADNRIRIWDALTGKPIDKTPPFPITKPVYRIAFSADSGRLASFTAERAKGDTTIQVWDLRSNASQTLVGHKQALTAIAFSPSGNLLFSAGHDNTLRSWNLTETTKSDVLQTYSQPVKALAFSPDGKHLACASKDKTIKLWSYQPQTREWIPLTSLTENNEITSLAFSPDGKTLVGTGRDNIIRLWDVTSPMSQPVLLNQIRGVQTCPSFSSDPRKLLTVGDNTLWLWQ